MKNSHAIFERLLLATNAQTDAALASALGVSAQSVSQAKKKEKIPLQWVLDVAEDVERYGVTSDWLFFGREPMRREDGLPNSHLKEDIKCLEEMNAALKCEIVQLKKTLDERTNEALVAYRKLLHLQGQ